MARCLFGGGARFSPSSRRASAVVGANFRPYNIRSRVAVVAQLDDVHAEEPLKTAGLEPHEESCMVRYRLQIDPSLCLGPRTSVKGTSKVRFILWLKRRARSPRRKSNDTVDVAAIGDSVVTVSSMSTELPLPGVIHELVKFRS